MNHVFNHRVARLLAITLLLGPACRAADDTAPRLVYHEITAQGQVIKLTIEPHQLRGRFGRLLGFVELPDGTMLNEQLLIAGLARADDRFSHRFLERFALLELQAKRERVGLWAVKLAGPMPTSDP